MSKSVEDLLSSSNRVEIQREMLPYLKQYWGAIQAPNPDSHRSTDMASYVEIVCRVLYLYLMVVGKLPGDKDFRELLVVAYHIHPKVKKEMKDTLGIILLMPEFDAKTGRINKEFKSSGEFHDWRVSSEKIAESQFKGVSRKFEVGKIVSSFDINKVKFGACDKVIDFTPRKMDKPKKVKEVTEVKSKTITLTVSDLLSKEELQEYISQRINEKTAFIKEDLERQRAEFSNQLLELTSLNATINKLNRDVENIKLAFGKAYSTSIGESTPTELNGARGKGLNKLQQPKLDLEAHGNLLS